MKKVLKFFRPVVMCLLIFTIMCGILYTGIITGIAQSVFPRQANGSVITVTLKDGTKKEIGTELIAQEFTQPEYLIGRPSGTSNLSPVGEEQQKLIKERTKWWHDFDPGNQQDIPADLVTSSGSGVDPRISPEAAEYQVSRIAELRNMEEQDVRNIVKKYTTDRLLGIWGERAVNVLMVNLALDGLL
ncbi:MAG: potassium-transporting ATPase, subunit [Caproiciproducens sp.]|jgi:K+-transporting ATPase ATPase C chain|nr:potassium-transporting ATPase, subunit [Caproiciproducens sp.]